MDREAEIQDDLKDLIEGLIAKNEKYGKRSKVRTAIREEPVKLAQYLRDEKGSYEPLWVIS